MNSALLPPSSPQNQQQINKQMHPQTASPPSHMPQNLVNLPVSAHQSNHYSLNVPNAPHYSPPNPSNNHPIANVSGGPPTYSPSKSVNFPGGYQPNLGHPPNQNPVPPISQNLPATTPVEPPQSNGTDNKSPDTDVAVTTPPEKSPTPSIKSEETPPLNEPPTPPEPVVPDPEPIIEKSSPVVTTEDEEPKQSPEVEKVKEDVKVSPKTSSRKIKTKADIEPGRIHKTPQKSPLSSKRTRIKTQPYQCPLPEIEIVTKISTATPRNKNQDEKLIVFYKNEFLAVRNSEGSFYVCQAVQNIYKSSPKIRIRWLSQDKTEKSGEIYTPDFYDHTDFDCILTNLNLARVDKGRFRLPAEEKERTDSILKRSLAVEKGEVTSPSLTEEHPDGIDVSLYKEESQLKKRKGTKRRATPLKKSKSTKSIRPPPAKSRKEEEPKVVKRATNRNLKTAVEIKKPVASTSSVSSRTDRAKRRSDNQNHTSKTTSPIVDQKKAKILAKVAKKGVKVTKKVKVARKIHKGVTKKSKKSRK